ncbi:hypothetical protein OOZ63_00435 [Paucibacter sp. PLA-PC-4]|nr:hypothetical protein [Paucibacter sp. PLA-PC-4]MCX2860304.1 hypothetical protein [Paucibacter sp. PLA-PC-4]
MYNPSWLQPRTQAHLLAGLWVAALLALLCLLLAGLLLMADAGIGA